MWCCHTILEKDMTTKSEFSMNYLPSNEKLMFLAIIIIPAATAMFVFKFLKKKKCHQIIKDEGAYIVEKFVKIWKEIKSLTSYLLHFYCIFKFLLYHT